MPSPRKTTRSAPGVRKRTYALKGGTKKTVYVARFSYTDGNGQRRFDESRRFNTRAEAISEYARMKSAHDSGSYTAPSTITLAEYVETHWLASITTRIKRTTADGYRRVWERHIKPELGSVRLQRLTPVQIDAFYQGLGVDRTVRVSGASGEVHEERRSALKPKTIRNIHLILGKALADAVDSELLTRNPAARAKPPRVVRLPEDEIRAWDAEELQAFLGYVRPTRWFPLIRLAAMTGMRRGEILGLRWSDVDFENRALTVRQTLNAQAYETYFDTPKSHKPRRIDLDPKTIKMLKRERKAQKVAQDEYGEGYLVGSLVFTNDNGSLIHPDTFSQAFERLVGQTRLPRLTLHGLRHTHATLLLKAGVPVNVVAQRLGHADPGFTLRQYAHVLPSMQASAARDISSLIDG